MEPIWTCPSTTRRDSGPNGDGLLLSSTTQVAGEGEGEGKVVRGRATTTLPVVLFNEFHSFKQAEKAKKRGDTVSVEGKVSSYRQKPHVALKELRKLAQDRESWRALASEIIKEK